tara:strand:+ start:288 stop:539 length:252 start_codon:yes stop_codon:yes gene_type:complete
MILFAKNLIGWLNLPVKNLSQPLKDKLVSRYLSQDSKKLETKSTDINILLNRVKLNQKSESRKKLYFSAAASTGLLLFGFLIF